MSRTPFVASSPSFKRNALEFSDPIGDKSRAKLGTALPDSLGSGGHEAIIIIV
jgi:hypothetical protein